MTRKELSNIAASVQAKLLNIAHAQHLDYNLMLKRFAMERLLKRLSLTSHADRFVLKGAMLFYAWGGSIFRPTKDLDLLGFGDPRDQELKAVFQELAATIPEPWDGLEFHPETVEVESIRDGELYAGMRVQLRASLEKSKVKVQVDVGFGDSVVPGPMQLEFPTLLDAKPFRMRAYRAETVVAEKLNALVKLDYATTRMKDLYDLWILSETREFSKKILSDAVRATFNRRGYPLSRDVPSGLTAEFYADPRISVRWQAWLRKTTVVPAPVSLKVLGEIICIFLLPVWETAGNADSGTDGYWQPRKGWGRESSGEISQT